MWTFDQWMHLLAVLAWPSVAVIAGAAWVHGCRLIAEVWLDAQRDRTQQLHDVANVAVSKICGAWMQTTARAAGPVPADWELERLAGTSERALLAVLAARGGFPARQNEAPGRSLVREVREMYAELERPTPRPEPVAGSPVPGMTDLMVSPESLDEYLADATLNDLYAGMVVTDEDTDMDTEPGMGDLE